MIPLGFFIGLLGTLVGAGGGFILMPILLAMYPAETPDHLTGISLSVIFFNALSGSISYARKGRVDWIAVRQFCSTAVPGAALGAWVTNFIPRAMFDQIFGGFLILAASYLFFKSRNVKGKSAPGPGGRTLTEADGTAHQIRYSKKAALLISFFIGFLSSLIGIGGGIIHVPAMVHFLNFPIHIATATSHAVLAVTSLVGLLTHIILGKMGADLAPIFLLTPGVLLGAPLGAFLSSKIRGSLILKILSLALLSVGLRLIYKSISG